METILLEGTHKVSYTQRPMGKSDPIRECARPTCYYWRVSCRGRGLLWLTTGSKTLAAAVLDSTHWREPAWSTPLAPLHSPQAPVLGCLRPNSRKDWTLPHPSAGTWFKVFLSTALPTRGQEPAPTTTGKEPALLIRKLAQAS